MPCLDFMVVSERAMRLLGAFASFGRSASTLGRGVRGGRRRGSGSE
jgi:hypothetical protein